MFLEFLLIKIFKNSRVIRILTLFNILLSDYVLYFLFKNSIRTGQFITSHKLFNRLNSRKINKRLSERFFVSKIVYFEVNLHLNKNFSISTDEKKYFILKEFINIKSKIEYKLLLKKNYFLTKNLFSEIIIEFIYCDSLIPVYKKYLKAEFFLNFLKNDKIQKTLELNYEGFKAIGHYPHLDTLIKGILLKLINVKKIYFNVKKNENANLYLYNYYKNILIKNNLFLRKKNKDFPVLNRRSFYIDKFKRFYSGDQISEYIQKKWNDKYFLKNNSSLDLSDKFYFNEMQKNFFNNKRIITVHIRQKGFHYIEDEHCKLRNSNLNDTLEVLNKIKSTFIYVLMGDTHIPNIKKKFDNVFNYAHSKLKSPMNDILLMKYCDAHIGTCSGLTHLSLTSGQPTLLVNWYPFEYSTKNNSTIFLPKLLFKNNKVFSIRDFYKIQIPVIYDGVDRLKNIHNISYRDNNKEEIFFALNSFIKSLHLPRWINYGVEYKIEQKNFAFHQIEKDLDKEIINSKRKIYFDPYFVKKNQGFL